MRQRDKQSGMTLVMVAMCLVMFISLAALAIDLGILYSARTSAQHSADAAALAGAYTFTNPAATQPDAARTAAKNIAAKTSILGKPVAISDDNIAVNLNARLVTVQVPRTGGDAIPLYFASIFGRASSEIAATATAECSKNAAGSRCLKPIYIPNTMLSALTPANACDAQELIFDANGGFTPFAQSQLGQQYKIRPTDPSSALASGQFFSLDFGAGANTYRCTLGTCLSNCAVDTAVVRCGQSFPLKTGDMVGPTKQGVGDLLGDTPDAWVSLGKYEHPDGRIYDTSHQLVLAPVWDNCSQKVSPGYKGQHIKIIGFVQMFIEGMENKDVVARLVNPLECSAGEEGQGSATGANTGPLGVPIRLVRTPAQ